MMTVPNARRRRSAVLVIVTALAAAAVAGGIARSAEDWTTEEGRLLLEEKARLEPVQKPPPSGVTKPDEQAARPADEPQPAYPTGIFTDQEAPAPAAQFLALNRWQGIVDGRQVAVYAGRAGENPGVGRILLVSKDATGVTTGQWIDTPDGPVQVVAVKGSFIVLRGQSGTGFLLDPATGQLS
jgi:hypothetical protein